VRRYKFTGKERDSESGLTMLVCGMTQAVWGGS
jgi:hypothetical protein